MFVTTLICGWIKAGQAAGVAADATATRLLAWMDDDPFGFCYQLEKDAAAALDKAGLAAFTNQVQARLHAATQATQAPGECVPGDQGRHARRRWAAVLRTLYLAQKDVDAYVGLARETGLTAEDCHAVATMLAVRKPDQALSWVERGIALDAQTSHGSFAGRSLAELRPRLLKRLGREHDARTAAWEEHRRHPSRYSYDELMKFAPKTERLAWHQRAIEAAMGAAYLSSLIELLLHTKEMDRLAELVRGSDNDALAAVSHYVAERAAQKLEKSHVGEAARLWCAQGMRILKAKKSKYYDAALRDFERARRCYERAGLAAEWQRVVGEVRMDHRRKTSFLPRFEEVVNASEPNHEPAFLDRAKTRWAAPHGETPRGGS